MTLAPAVLKAASAPLVVPALLVATRRKWYVAAGARPETPTLTLRRPAAESRRVVDDRDPYRVLAPYSKYQLVVRPRGSTAPVSVAVVEPTPCAAPVSAAGAATVTNVWSPPTVVPEAFVATRRKWYVAPGLRPASDVETFLSFVPEPALCAEVDDPYAVLVPYSKRQLVSCPLGSTLPLSLADDDETELAGRRRRARRSPEREGAVAASARAGVARGDEPEVVDAARLEPGDRR